MCGRVRARVGCDDARREVRSILGAAVEQRHQPERANTAASRYRQQCVAARTVQHVEGQLAGDPVQPRIGDAQVQHLLITRFHAYVQFTLPLGGDVTRRAIGDQRDPPSACSVRSSSAAPSGSLSKSAQSASAGWPNSAASGTKSATACPTMKAIGRWPTTKSKAGAASWRRAMESIARRTDGGNCWDMLSIIKLVGQ